MERTYEYYIQQFVSYEGVKGGEFYTPASIVKTIVAILRLFKNCRVYDPCRDSGTTGDSVMQLNEDDGGTRNIFFEPTMKIVYANRFFIEDLRIFNENYLII